MRFKIDAMITGGKPEDIERMMARLAADEQRPFDDPARIREFPKYGRPLVKVAGIYGQGARMDQHVRPD